MRELVTMWLRPRMVGLVVVSAVSYALFLVPFKGLAILPGFSSIRPGSALPVVLGLLFGPAGAWGAGFGNLLGDYFGGTWNPLTPFGFAGNLLYGVVSYKLWDTVGCGCGGPPSLADGRQFRAFVVVSMTAAAATANVIAWGGELTGLFAFSVFASVVLVNNVFVVLLVGPPLLYFLYPRAKDAGLLYTQLMPAVRAPVGGRATATARLATAAVLVWTGVGFTLSLAAGVELGVSPDRAMGSGGSVRQVALGAAGIVATVVALAATPSDFRSSEPTALGDGGGASRSTHGATEEAETRTR